MNQFKLLMVPCAIVFIIIGAAFSDQICDLRLTECPEDYNGENIYVPKMVVALSSNFHVCEPQNVVEDITTGKPPSIMFLIDNSGSMIGSGGSVAKDKNGERYKVTRALIDTIYKTVKNAEVGIVVFSGSLFFDSRTNPNFATLPDGYSYPLGYRTQAYLPLLKLDSTVQGGMKAIDLIRDLLKTRDTTFKEFGIGETINGHTIAYQPQFEVENSTNINTAFDAAKYAMEKATNSKEDQYIIFFSDGEPMPATDYVMDRYHGGKLFNEFEKGTNIPTTFTIYLVEKGDDVPQSINRMTDNIKNNGYSTKNKSSNVWGLESSYSTLLSTLLNNVIKPMLVTQQKVPKVLNLNGTNYSDYRPVDSSFYLPGGLKLKDSITNVKMEINYKVKQVPSNEIRDTIVKIEFNIVRTDDIPQSEGVLLDCRDTVIYTVSLVATDPNASESDDNTGLFEFTRNSAVGDLTVYFEISGTAKNGVDYDPVLDSIVFKSGESKSTLKVKPIKDDIEEGEEDVTIKLLSSKDAKIIRYGISTPNTATVKITDDFTPMQVSVFAIDSKAHEVGSDPAVIEFRRNKVDGNLTVYFEISGTAKNGEDYTSISESIVFNSGDAVSTLKIVPFTDNFEEGDETVTITILGSKSGFTIDYQTKSPDNATITIYDKVIKDTLRVLVAPNPYSFDKSGNKSDDLRELKDKFYSVFNPKVDGILISIYSSKALNPDESNKDLFGKVLIYDAIGNIVNKLDIKCIEKNQWLYGSLWEGTNYKHRRVGSGVYLVRISITDRHGKLSVFTSKVGIK